jgi:hypothetical protein
MIENGHEILKIGLFKILFDYGIYVGSGGQDLCGTDF